jgi:ribosomal protein S18 acetylase RimI-like enzyme
MTRIINAEEKDSFLLAHIGKQTFIESHGNSAGPEVINTYVNAMFNDDVLRKEISEPENIYHIIYHNGNPAGYSKIIYNAAHKNIPVANVTKLERLYLLQAFYNLHIGAELFKYNVELSKQKEQAGMWLFVWKENHRAIRFYAKAGFTVVGSYNFKLSETHANPNYQMYLQY